MRLKQSFLLILLFALTTANCLAQLIANNESGLLWMTEEYPPYNFHDPEGNLQGISVEILLRVMEHMEISFSTDDILVLPWARAYKEAQHNPKAALFTMNYSQDRAEQFNFVGPISASTISIFTTSKHIDLNNIEQLSTLNVGVVRNDIGEQLLDKYGLKASAKVKLPTSLETIRMLLLNRVDAIALEENIAKYEFRRLGVDEDSYRVLHIIEQSSTHFAFNKNVPMSFVNEFSIAFNALQNQGVVQEIQDKYAANK